MTATAVVIPVPSREQRRLRAKPQMPVIEEDHDLQRVAEEGDVVESSSAASTMKGAHKRSLSTSSSVSASDGHQSSASDASLQPPGSPTSVGSGGSLLDTLHKKYYPDQYKRGD